MIKQTKLYKALSSRVTNGDPIAEYLKSYIDFTYRDYSNILNDVRVYFRHYTDHSITHSIRIISNIGSILTEEQLHGTDPISTLDIFVIIMSALIHDVGMVIPDSEIDSIINEEEFQRIKNRIAAEFDEEELCNDWFVKGISRLVIADYVRRHYPDRSAKMVVDSKTIAPLTAQLSKPIINAIAAVAKSHGDDLSSIYELPSHLTISIKDEMLQETNMQFCAFCLRLGDLLDITSARCCPLLRNLSEPLPYSSSKHWSQYSNIAISGLKPNSEIVIRGTCPNQDSERMIRNWIQWADNEASRAVLALNEDCEKYRLKIGRINVDITAEKDSFGTPKYEFTEFKFNLDEKLVFERLFGRSLYGRPILALRELIQNSIDASKAMLISKYLNNTEQIDNKDIKRSLLSDTIKKHADDFPIVFRTYNEELREDDDVRTWLEITDNGIGMTRNDIQRYLLKIGKSKWAEDLTANSLGLGESSIGKFGIGFISTFMIADRIEIETNSASIQENSIKATIYNWQGYLGTEPSSMKVNGTSIRLRLLPNVEITVINLPIILKLIAPSTEFRIQCNNSDNIVNNISNIWIDGISNEKHNVLSFPQSDSKICFGQYFNLAESHRKLAERQNLSSQPVVSQDGIAISELRYLEANSPPSYKVLFDAGIYLDIKDKYRVPLDLSRNLPEMGVEAFWRKYIPIIWNVVLQHIKLYRESINLIENLIEHEFLTITCNDFKIAMKNKFISCIEDVETPQLALYDLKSKTIGLFETCSTVSFLPPADHHKLVTFVKEDIDDFMDPEMSHLTLSNINNYTRNIDNSYARICDNYQFIYSHVNKVKILSKNEMENCYSTNELLFFKISETYISIRSPVTKTHHLIPSIVLDAIFSELMRHKLDMMSLYISCIYYLYRDIINNWVKAVNEDQYAILIQYLTDHVDYELLPVREYEIEDAEAMEYKESIFEDEDEDEDEEDDSGEDKLQKKIEMLSTVSDQLRRTIGNTLIDQYFMSSDSHDWKTNQLTHS